MIKSCTNADKLFSLIIFNNAIPEFLVFSFRHSITAAKRLCILRRNVSYQNKIYTFSCIHDYNQSTDLMYPINVPCKIQHVLYWYEVVSGAEIIDSQVKCLWKITFCQHLGFFDTRLCFYKRYLCLLYDDANIEWLHKPNLTSWIQPK